MAFGDGFNCKQVKSAKWISRDERTIREKYKVKEKRIPQNLLVRMVQLHLFDMAILHRNCPNPAWKRVTK